MVLFLLCCGLPWNAQCPHSDVRRIRPSPRPNPASNPGCPHPSVPWASRPCFTAKMPVPPLQGVPRRPVNGSPFFVRRTVVENPPRPAGKDDETAASGRAAVQSIPPRAEDVPAWLGGGIEDPAAFRLGVETLELAAIRRADLDRDLQGPAPRDGLRLGGLFLGQAPPAFRNGLLTLGAHRRLASCAPPRPLPSPWPSPLAFP